MNTPVSSFLIGSFIFSGNNDMHKSFDEFEFWPNSTTINKKVSCP